MIVYTVKCEIHGEMEIMPKNGEQCPRICFIQNEKGDFCNHPLKRIWDVPNVHFHGDGFTKTSA